MCLKNGNVDDFEPVAVVRLVNGVPDAHFETYVGIIRSSELRINARSLVCGLGVDLTT